MAAHLFSTIDELQKYFPFDGEIKFWELEADLSLVEEKYLIEDLVGSTTFNMALAEIEVPTVDQNPFFMELIERMRAPAAKLTALYHLPEANVKYGGAGLLVTRTEKVVPASDNRKKDLELSLKHKSQDLLDMLLRYLERNTAIFVDWAASEERKIRSKLLPDAKSFSAHFDISENHWIYRKIQNLILEVEDQDITNLIGAEYLTELRTQLAENSLSADNEIVMRLIRPILANKTMANAFPRLRINISPRGLIMFSNERGSYDDAYIAASDNAVSQMIDKCTSTAATFASRLTELLNTQASDTKYIAYKNSDLYADPDIDINDFGNDPDDPERNGYYAG